MRPMRVGIRGTILGGILAVLSGATGVHAQASEDDGAKIVDDEQNLEDEIAKNHHRTGTQYYEAGRFTEAGDEFTKSYNLSKRPIALFNAYIAYRNAGDDKKAADALRLYLQEAEEIDDRQDLEARLENLEARLKALEARDAEIRQKELEAEAAREKARQAEAARTGAEDEPEDGPGVGPVILMGAGGAMIIGGVITGIINRGIVSEIEEKCGANKMCPAEGFDLEGKKSSADTTALLTDILIIGGAAVAAGGLIWYLVGQPDEAPPASAYCTGDGCGAVVRGRF